MLSSLGRGLAAPSLVGNSFQEKRCITGSISASRPAVRLDTWSSYFLAQVDYKVFYNFLARADVTGGVAVFEQRRCKT